MICPKCGGSGEVESDLAVGIRMRRLRLAKGISLRLFAQSLGISTAYLCDLELGRRHWNAGIRTRFVDKLLTSG